MGNKNSKKQRKQNSVNVPEASLILEPSPPTSPPPPPVDPDKMLFGIPLKLSAERSDEARLVPSPVRLCIEFLENKDLLKTTGIFRISGSMKRIQQYISMFNSGEPVVFPENEDVHNVVGVLKAFFRELPEPVFTNEARSDFRNAGDILEEDKKVKQIRKILLKLPPSNRETLRILVFHLSHVAQLSDDNKMTATNLTFSLCPELGSVFTSMIENYEATFENMKPSNDLTSSKHLSIRNTTAAADT